MMLIIHGIPLKMKFAELKAIISGRCDVKEYLLDRFMADEENNGQTKRVRVGCVDDQQGLIMLKKLNGLRVHDHVLKVKPLGNIELPQEPKFNTWNNNSNNQNCPMPPIQDNYQGYQGPPNAGPSFGGPPGMPYEPPNNFGAVPWNNPYGAQQNPVLNNDWQQPTQPLQLNSLVPNLLNVIEQVAIQQGIRLQSDMPNQPHWEGIQDGTKPHDMDRGPSAQNHNQFRTDNSRPSVMDIQSKPQGSDDFRKVSKKEMEYRGFSGTKEPRDRGHSPPRDDRYPHGQNESNWNRDRPDIGRMGSDIKRRFSPTRGPRGISPQSSHRFRQQSPAHVPNDRRKFSPSFDGKRKETDLRRSPVRGSGDIHRFSPPGGLRHVGRKGSPHRIEENFRGSSYREMSPPRGANRERKKSLSPDRRNMGRMSSGVKYDDFPPRRSPSQEGEHGGEFRSHEIRKSRFADGDDKDYNIRRGNWKSSTWQDVSRRDAGQNMKSKNSPDLDRYSPTSHFMDSEANKAVYGRPALDKTVKDRNVRQGRPWEQNTGFKDSQDYVRQDFKPSLRTPPRSRSRSPIRRSRSSRERAHSPHGSWSQRKPRMHSPLLEDAPSPPSWTDHKHMPGESENRWGKPRVDSKRKSFDEFDIEGRHGATQKFEKRNADNMRYEYPNDYKEGSRGEGNFKPHGLPSRSEFIQRSEDFARNQDKAFGERRYVEGQSASHEFDAPESRGREPEYDHDGEREINNAEQKVYMCEKTSERIARKVLVRHQVKPISDEYKTISLKLVIAITKLMNDVVGDRDFTMKQMLNLFSKEVSLEEEDKIFEDIMAGGTGDVVRVRNPGGVVFEQKKRHTSRWDIKPSIAELHGLQQFSVVQPSVAPIVPMQVALMNAVSNAMQPVNPLNFSNPMSCVGMSAPIIPNPTLEPNILLDQTAPIANNYQLSLCKLNFSPFVNSEVDDIKKFVVGRIFEASASDVTGWSPTVTIKGLQTSCRYELLAEDEKSYKWLMGIDFTQFKSFDVVLYTKDELWYERASIFLKDSIYWQLEPLQKLKLQNRYLEGVDIGKWKLVKKIVSNEGIRIYVDIPPSSKVALEKYNMSLSYEFHKVTVVMRTSVLDPVKFDAGLHSSNVISTQQYVMQIQIASLPIMTDKDVVRLSLEDSACNVTQAKRIRDKVLQVLYDYLTYNKVDCKTDFIKCGYSSPGHLGILPENKGSRDWFKNRFFGIVSGRKIVVLENENDVEQFFRVTAVIPLMLTRKTQNPSEILKIVADATVGMRLNIDKWRIVDVIHPISDNSMFVIKLDIDLESVHTLDKRSFGLGFKVDNRMCYIKFNHECPDVQQFLSKFKIDVNDSYVVTNMDLDSD